MERRQQEKSELENYKIANGKVLLGKAHEQNKEKGEK